VFGKHTPSELDSLLAPWNETMINFGVKIIQRRLTFVKEFHEYVDRNFKDIAGQPIVPIITYESTLGSELPSDEVELAGLFRRKLDDAFKMEIKRGMSLIGPHRDRYHFLIPKDGNLFELKTFGSQGEQKTFLAALKLSEYMYLRDKNENGNAGEPILLLDDLFSELDKNRISNLTVALTKFNQIFLTSTNQDYLCFLKNRFESADISAFCIKNGTAVLTN